MKKDKITQLNTTYSKRLKNMAALGINNKDIGLDFLAEHLRYLRDRLILKNISNLEQEPAKTDIALLASAIAEFDAYQGTQEITQKTFHLNTFCDFLRLNMGEWLTLNDSI
jgi:hypothetical protein